MEGGKEREKGCDYLILSKIKEKKDSIYSPGDETTPKR